jgi:ABC-2 type transport system ATP-binding protein
MNCIIKNLSKSYSSGFRLGPIDLSIRQGEIVGLLGPNGAGKTTLIRLLLGALKADTGSACLLGVDVRKQTFTRRWIGYLDEEPIHYDWMKIRWLARFYSSYYPSWDHNRFLSQLKTFSLNQSLRLRQLSKGSKVRLGFALSLAHSPRLLLLDEPTSGLDPLVRAEILDAIAQYVHNNPEVSVLFSSHITPDLERVCNRAIMLEKGRVISDTQIRAPNCFNGSEQKSPSNVGTLEEKFLRSMTSNLIQ